MRYLVDPLVVEGSAWVTGANAEGKHAAFVVRGRDFVPDGELGAVEIRDGDRCARCGGALEIARGIELGHVFQLGRKFAEAFGLTALDENGKPVTITMGSYGVGVTRAVAAIAEQTHDEKGLCWPPFGGTCGRARRRHRQGRRDLRRGRRPGRRPGDRRCAGAVRRPARGLARREVHGRRAARRADDRDRRPRPGRRRGRAARPPYRRAPRGRGRRSGRARARPLSAS